MEQPNIELQRALDDVIEDKKELVEIPGTKKFFSKKAKSVKVGFLKRYTLRKITNISLDARNDESTESKMLYKQAAFIVLNNYFLINFFHAILWRWYYYVKEYNPEQLLPIIDTGKKKVPLTGYWMGTISTTNMRDTIMSMTRKEVELSLHAHQSEKKES